MRRNQTVSNLGNTPCSTPARRGVTLVEVLMSLMIMSIGVSAVAVLFPISMLRSLQATQLTNAAILKFKVEAFLDTNPNFLFDPDGDGDLVEHFRNPADRNYVIDPSGYYTHLADDNPFRWIFGHNGVSPAGAIRRFGGGLRTIQDTSIQTYESNDFDSNGAVPAPAITAALKLKGQELGGQGDGWTTVLDAVPVELTANQIRLQPPPDLDMSDIATSAQLSGVIFNSGVARIPDPENYRVVAFNATGRVSQSYPLLFIDTTTNIISFSEDLNNNGTLDGNEDFNGNRVLDNRSFPVEFYVDADFTTSPTPVVSRVLIQNRRINDFSWLLTVRRRGDGAVRNVDVVVKFSDGADTATERVFGGSMVRGQAVLGVVEPADGAIPKIQKGKFVFDSTNALWYRIRDFETAPLVPSGSDAFSWATYKYRVYLEEAVKVSAGSDANDGILNGNDISTLGPVMFPVGIVDVYPMGSRQLPYSTN